MLVAMRRLAVILAGSLALHLDGTSVSAFSTPFPRLSAHICSLRRTSYLRVDDRQSIFLLSAKKEKTEMESEVIDDKTLLRTVTTEQLKELCRTLQLPTVGTKQEMLDRLRELAKRNAELEYQRIKGRKKRAEEGSGNPNEKFVMVSSNSDEDDDDEEELEPIFYYPIPAKFYNDTEINEAPSENDKPEPPKMISAEQITAPPAPPGPPNDQGERSVTVYSTTDQNDLTGVAAAQPGASSQVLDSLSSSSGSSLSSEQPWEKQRSELSNEQEEQAKTLVVELVDALLAMTDLPSYTEELDLEEEDEDEEEGESNARKAQVPRMSESIDQPIGFQPNKVSSKLLSAASQALRTKRGQILDEVMRQYELQAVGLDGMAADDVENGGGHYKEVSKVRAFLEGYRRAEVRRISRETTTMLLDKLVSEGVEGLDLCLAGMIRSSDDTSDTGGELNDSLLEYLNDAVRQQQQKVNQMKKDQAESKKEVKHVDETDSVDDIWELSTEDGKRVESLDPRDPKVKKVLKEEYLKMQNESPPADDIPETVPEKILLLLTLLRDRIKTEAVFGHDEKGRNLRLLAYCLKVAPDERKGLIMKEIGSSLDKLDSFVELVLSSIEYGESTSHLLQPGKKTTLNLKQLNSILEAARSIREQQAFKAGVGELDI